MPSHNNHASRVPANATPLPMHVHSDSALQDPSHLQPRFPSGSNFKKDETNLLKRTFKITSSDSLKNKNPRTSMSQLKLRELAEVQHHELLERFDIEELRDGFFDPIYTKHVNVGDSQLNVSTGKSSGAKPRSRLSLTKGMLLRYVEKYCAEWKINTKFTLAYLIAVVLCLIDKSGNWLGSHRAWLPISVLINHPVHNIGTQAEITVLSIVGLAIGLCWSSLALYISTATQPTRNHQGGVLAGSLFIGLFFMGWFRAYYIRFYYMLLTSGLALIFLSTNLKLDEPVVHWRYAWEFAIPYLFGLLVSLFVSIVYFPHSGREKMVTSVLDSSERIRKLLEALSTVQRGSDSEILPQLQKDMIASILSLSENFREFLSGFKFSLYDDEDLKSIRNHLNFIATPLRVIPTPVNIYFSEASGLPMSNADTPEHGSTQFSSGVATPVPKSHLPTSVSNHPKFGVHNELIYMSIMDDAFNAPLFKLINQMVEQLTQIETTIRVTSRLGEHSQLSKSELISQLSEKRQILKKRVYEMDVAYRKFTKTEYFCRDLLNEEAVINIFLVLRYTRQAAVMLFNLTDTVIASSERVTRWKAYWPNYPFQRGLRRLPEQCLRDQGADEVFHYFETKLDVVDAFERIYNLNTSRNKETRQEDSKVVRAIDHKDFNSHATKNPLRFKLWMLANALNDSETKYAFKVAFITLFLALPAWLDESWGWYWTYNCYWCPILVYYFLSPKNSSNWENLGTRSVCWLIGCFWGWAANAARQKNHIVIGVFSALICLVFSYGFLVLKHPRSSLVALLGYTIVSMIVMVEADDTSGDIFHYSWSVAVSILVALFASVLSNWIIWPFVAKKELYRACSSLLQHISQSYQSVSERYLYRDENDDPTDLTLELANIREVRMSQSLMAVKLLLKKARKDNAMSGTFKPSLFEKMLDSCDMILEKIIEARMSGVYFKVWEQDKDVATTQALLSFRRDSVATVIYLLYVLSNAFMSKTQVPRYLPSAIGIRKKLYDTIGQLELERDNRSETIVEQLTERLTSVQSGQSGDTHGKSYEKSHWTEVHGMAFARAFTSITEELENVVHLTREILGEEGILE